MAVSDVRTWLMAFAVLAAPILARADAVIDWYKIATSSASAAKQNPVAVTRTIAIVHTAMFDAMNTIEPTSYKVKISAPAGSSVEAPGVVAAHAALVQRLPDQKAVSAARIYGGIHFRTSNMAGQVMGRKIAELSVNNYLKPIH